jgi:hypothetical protein
MKFSNIAKFFTLPTLTEIANIYNDNDEIQIGNIAFDVNEKIKCYNIKNYFTLPTLTEIANIYNDNDNDNDNDNNEIQTGNIIQDGIIVSGVN